MISILSLDKIILYLILAFSLVAGISRGGLNTIVSLLAVCMIIRFYKEPLNITVESNIVKALKLLFGALLVSAVFSTHFFASVRQLLWTAFRIAPFFYAVAFVKNKRDLEKIALFLAVSLLLGSIVGISQGLQGVARVKSYLGIMDFAGALGLLIPFLLVHGFEFREKLNVRNYFFIFVALIASIALLFNETRAVWLSVIINFITYFVITFKQNKKIAAVIAAILVGIFLVGSSSSSFTSRFDSIADTHMSSNAKRIAMWDLGWGIFKENPIVGVGLGCLPASNYDGVKYNIVTTDPIGSHVHNNFLQMLAESGLVGFSAFCVLFGTILYVSIKQLRLEENRKWAIIMLLCTIDFLIHGLFDYTFNLATVMYTYWFIIGLSLASFSVNSPNKKITDNGLQ